MVLWGHGLSLARRRDQSSVFYAITGHGITVGFHRYFTHGSFKAGRARARRAGGRRVMAVEGPVTRWVADHRRHHAYSDKEGDPHSPWRYGENFPALCKGLWHAHIGWLFDVEQTDQKRFAPDLLADRDVDGSTSSSRSGCSLSLGLPALVGGLWAQSWQGAAHRVLLGQRRAHGRAAPLHLVDQLDLPHLRRAAVPDARQEHQRVAAGAPSAWASAGTTCTTPTRPRPGTGSTAGRSTPAPSSSAAWRSWAWRPTCAGPPRAAGRAPGRAA